jgi:hypothetical protein
MAPEELTAWSLVSILGAERIHACFNELGRLLDPLPVGAQVRNTDDASMQHCCSLFRAATSYSESRPRKSLTGAT